MGLALDGTDALLGDVCPHVSARGSLSLSRLQRTWELDTTPGEFAVEWVTCCRSLFAINDGPRHQSIRCRGIAPAYPDSSAFDDARPGRLILSRDGFQIGAGDSSEPELIVRTSDISRMTFYSNCVEVLHGQGKLTLIRSENIDALDVFCQAYY